MLSKQSLKHESNPLPANLFFQFNFLGSMLSLTLVYICELSIKQKFLDTHTHFDLFQRKPVFFIFGHKKLLEKGLTLYK